MADCSLSELYERIGRNIAYLRKSRKLTQQEFANKLHICLLYTSPSPRD